MTTGAFHSTKNSENSGTGSKWNGNFPESNFGILGQPREMASKYCKISARRVCFPPKTYSSYSSMIAEYCSRNINISSTTELRNGDFFFLSGGSVNHLPKKFASCPIFYETDGKETRVIRCTTIDLLMK